MSRTSVWSTASCSATALPTPQVRRQSVVNHRTASSSPAALGAASRSTFAARLLVPHRSIAATESAISSCGSCQGVSSVIVNVGAAANSTSPETRWPREAAATIARNPLSSPPKTTVRFEPASSSTASMSSSRSSIGGHSPGESRSEQPHPRLSITISRENDANPSRNRAYGSCSQSHSTFEA